MRYLELLAPARTPGIGIAAIDCGADAVYIAGPSFGARKAAGNSIEDIVPLCEHAHKFGARVFLTVNTILEDSELGEVRSMMLSAQDAGIDAFIIRDARIAGWKDITVPLHASTQCAIRDLERALYYERIGCSRLILERELSLDRIREICSGVGCEVEFFVHGALCVCYSGECRLSEVLDGRSGDRGDCIQACRSRYDLYDAGGTLLLKDKAVLSLKDFNLQDRLPDLAEAGVSSFKIEGRLKNESYVKNVVREYSLALDGLVARNPEKYRRASFGRVEGGFVPDSSKTFNRGYTQLYLDGRRGQWSSMDTAKSIGEFVGTVSGVRKLDAHSIEISVRPVSDSLEFHNGDGFAFPGKGGATGFRADVCHGGRIVCRDVPGIHKGVSLYRNVNTAFEHELESRRCRREIGVCLSVRIHGEYNVDITARTEDGREVFSPFKADVEAAENARRAQEMIREQLSKRCGHYSFTVEDLVVESRSLPLLSASTLNGMRRLVCSDLDAVPFKAVPLSDGKATIPAPSEVEPRRMDPLMRSRYCVRHELGMCPVHQGYASGGPLYITNNGRRFKLDFDCRACEMTVER